MPSEDALDVLRQVYDEVKPDFPQDLLDHCYKVEKTHQYNQDRELALNELRRIVTLFVEEEFARNDS